MKNEQKFYEALQNIFVGAPIEGDGGYVNLLKVKERYYSEVIAKLRANIDNDTVITEDYKENFYNMLYSFFEKYFSECGSVYFVKTANWQRVYEKVYTSNRDVVLFWKTHMLYYVKTDMLFNSAYVKVKADEAGSVQFVFYFDVADLQNKQNNEKKELLFSYRETKTEVVEGIHNHTTGDKTFIIDVAYKQGRAQTKLSDIARKTFVSEETINRAIKMFKKQTSVDFFINKNAKSFLEEQLDLFLHQILLDEESQFEQTRLEQLKTLKKYAKDIIAFISQFEDELVRIWEKPKFVLNSNYVITLDKLNDEVIKKISKHKGLTAQIQEWKDLYFVDDDFVFSDANIVYNPHLPIDTKYFKDLEIEILSQFDNLDEALNGRLIKSENYQALNTIKKRYDNSVQCVYIDPPFNTGEDFVFMDAFKDSTWLNLIYDRLLKAKTLLKKNGSIYMELDHIAEHYGKILLDNVFGVENYMGKITWNTGDNISGFKSQADYWIRQADYIHFYTNATKKLGAKPDTTTYHKFIKVFELTKENLPRKEALGLGWLDLLSVEKKKYYVEKWQEGKLVNVPITGIKAKAKGTIWNDIYSFQYSEPRISESISFVSNQKPENLLRRIIQSATNQNDLVLDFFLGSGTTTSVAHKLNRKWIGVEMGDYFYNTYNDIVCIDKKDTDSDNIDEGDNEENSNLKDLSKNINEAAIVDVLEETTKKKVCMIRKLGIIGRMKNVLKGDQRFWPISSKVQRRPHLSDDINWQGGGFFKYYELEQYEDVLNRAKYSSDKGVLYEDGKKVFSQYVFFADEKLADVLDVNGDDIQLNFTKLYKNIDFPETISLLYGKAIEKITEDYVKLADISNPIKYNVTKMNAEEKIDFAKMLKPLLWWGK